MAEGEPGKKIRLIQIIVMVASVFAIALTIFYVAVWYVPDNSEKVGLIRQGLEASYTNAMRLPGASNAWVDYKSAFSKAVGLKSLQGIPDDLDYFQLVERNLTPENLRFAMELTRLNNEAFSLVDEGFKKDKLLIIYDFKRPLAVKSPNYIQMRNLALGLAVASNYERLRGDRRMAAVRAMECIFFGVGVRRLGGLIQSATGTLYEYTALNVLNSLAAGDLSKEECRYILEELDRIYKDAPNFRETLDGELIYMENVIDAIQCDNTGSSGSIPRQYSGRKMNFLIMMYLKRERIICENWYLASVQATSGNYPGFRKMAAKPVVPPFAPIAELICTDIEGGFSTYLYVKTRLNGIRTLIALKLFMLEKGAWPDSLGELVPGYLSSLPEDYFSDKGSFCYEKNGQKILLYSVGPDMIDERGRTEATNAHAPGDIVIVNQEK